MPYICLGSHFQYTEWKFIKQGDQEKLNFVVKQAANVVLWKMARNKIFWQRSELRGFSN